MCDELDREAAVYGDDRDAGPLEHVEAHPAQHPNSLVCLNIRMSQHVEIFIFFNVFIIRQAHLPPKVLKQTYFRISLQNSRAEIELCENILALRCDKTIKDRELIFVVRFLSPSSSKHKFTIPIKNILVLNY